MENRILQGDVLSILKTLDDESVHCCVTSPPYWGLRDYDVEGQIGLEKTPEEYVARLVEVFREVRRVLRDDGTLWLILGDSYNGSGGAGGDYNTGGLKEGQNRYPGRNVNTLKSKDLVGIPWRVGFALQADGWWLRSDIIWAKPNPMPSSVKDRPTSSHEHVFLLAKSKKYYYDAKAIKEASKNGGKSVSLGEKSFSKGQAKGIGIAPSGNALKDNYTVAGLRNKRDVWWIATQPYPEAHFAVYPPELIRPCILAGCPSGGVVLDPFFGAGTTGLVTKQEGRHYIGIELNPEYVEMAKKRIQKKCPMERLI